jgi:hypothetical protein
MKNYPILFAIFCLFLVGCTEEKKEISMLSLLPENPKYFLFRGEPTLLITSAEHYGILMNSAFDYDTYLETLAKDSLNLTRIFSGAYLEHSNDFNIFKNTMGPDSVSYLAPWARSTEKGYANGGNKFDLSTWDARYFERLHHIFQKASEKGIVIEFNFFCPMYNEALWDICPMNASNNMQGIGAVGFEEVYKLERDSALLGVQEKLVRKFVQELNQYDNLYFEICNEPYFGGVEMQWQHHITDIVVETEKELPNKHLISVNVANETAKIENPHPSWSIFNFHYATPPVAVTDNAAIQGVIGMNETGFHGVSDDYYRQEAWEFMMAGGGLYNNLDYSFIVGYEDGSLPIVDPAPGGGGIAFRRQIGFMRQFLEDLDIRKIKPLTAISERIVQGVPENIIPYGLADDSKVFAFYLRAKTPNLTLVLPEASYQIRIADPAGAKWISDTTIKHSGGKLKLDIPEGSGKDVAAVIQALR